MDPVSMNLDAYEVNTEEARTARPQANMMLGVLPVRKPSVTRESRNDEYVCLSVLNNNISQDILIPKAAWDVLRKCRCVFAS